MMSLKKRFLLLNMLSVFVAIILTALVVVGFVWYYFSFGNSPMEGAINARKVPELLFKNDTLLYSNKPIERIDVLKILDSAQGNDDTFFQDGTVYHLAVEHFVFEDGSEGKIIRLIANFNQNSFYTLILSFSAIVFFILFLIANMVVVKYFKKAIIRPVERLKVAAQSLTNDDMDFGIREEGEGEVRALCLALEMLRLKLKETLNLQNRYEENRKFLLSTISHDLKTPVTSIKGYIDGILDGVANTPEKIDRYLKTASEKTVQLNAMIDNLLLYSKLDLEQIPYHFQKVELCKYISNCVADDMFAFASEAKVVTFVNEEKKGGIVSIDEEQFRRVHQNVIDNARKHIQPATGCVTISIRETPTSVILEYHDNGVGIKKEDLPHIFDRFYRGDAARKTDGSSGLGLAIAKNIVEGHGGRIWAISDGQQGTSILISLKKVYGDRYE